MAAVGIYVVTMQDLATFVSGSNDSCGVSMGVSRAFLSLKGGLWLRKDPLSSRGISCALFFGSEQYGGASQEISTSADGVRMGLVGVVDCRGMLEFVDG